MAAPRSVYQPAAPVFLTSGQARIADQTTRFLKYLLDDRDLKQNARSAYCLQSQAHSAIRTGFLNDHTACHGRVQTAEIVVTARCMT